MRDLRTTAMLLVGAAGGAAGCASSEPTAASTSALTPTVHATMFDGTRSTVAPPTGRSATDTNNIFLAKTDVYLAGGPLDDAIEHVLPDGDYYFQVTDPSGKTVLSQDAVGCREIRIATGQIAQVFEGPGCLHTSAVDTVDGGMTVQLMPFADTPNPGDEYKTWIAPVASFTGAFMPEPSHTANFKVIDAKTKP